MTQELIESAIRAVIRSGQGEELSAALAAQIADGRMLAWARDAEVQAVIAETGLAGALDQAKGPHVDVATVGDDALALDAYLQRDAEYRVARCQDVRGQVRSEVEVTVRSALPKDPTDIPAGLLGGAEAGSKGPRHKVVVQVHLPRSAELVGVRLEGEQVRSEQWLEQGRPAVAVAVTLPPRSARTVRVSFDAPLSGADGSIGFQPLVRAWEATVVDRPC